MVAQKVKEETSIHDPVMRPTPSPTEHAVVLSAPATYYNQDDPIQEKEDNEEEEDGDEEDHFRHRRLTGDSGIEVCRCHVKREDREGEELQKRHFDRRGCKIMNEGDGADPLPDHEECSLQAKATAQSPHSEDHSLAHDRWHKTGEAVITVVSS